MPDQLKIRRLQALRALLTSSRMKEADKQAHHIADTDGRMVRMSDDDAIEVIDRRIAAEQAAA